MRRTPLALRSQTNYRVIGEDTSYVHTVYKMRLRADPPGSTKSTDHTKTQPRGPSSQLAQLIHPHRSPARVRGCGEMRGLACARRAPAFPTRNGVPLYHKRAREVSPRPLASGQSYSHLGSVVWAGVGSVGFTPRAGRGSGRAVVRQCSGRAVRHGMAGLRFGWGRHDCRAEIWDLRW